MFPTRYLANLYLKACATGGFITAPTLGQVVNASSPVTFSWDSSCLNITSADVFLYAPDRDTPLIQVFEGVDFTKGSYNVRLIVELIRCHGIN